MSDDSSASSAEEENAREKVEEEATDLSNRCVVGLSLGCRWDVEPRSIAYNMTFCAFFFSLVR